MKVLRLSQYIMNSNHPEHNKIKSGYGRSVWDISRHSAKSGNEEYLYTYGNANEIYEDGVHLIEGNWPCVLKSMNLDTSFSVFMAIMLVLKLKKVSLRRKVSIILQNTRIGYISRIIKEIEPDIIHIHGLTYSTYPFVRVAQKSGIPYVITLHGLNMDVFDTQIERDFEIKQIESLNQNNITITVIGSGMKETINKRCKILNHDKLVTINHGIDGKTFALNQNAAEVRKQLGIENKKVILSVGSLSDRRNQICLIRSISLMNSDEKNNVVIYIVGQGPMKEILISEINRLGLSQTVFLLGEKNHTELSKLYSIANVTAVLSKIEGFGRPILESFLFGVPVVAFNDLDAVQDLYEEGCMFPIGERNDNAVCSKLKEVLGLNINSNLIKSFASTKTWSASSDKYQAVYDLAIKDFKLNRSVLNESSC